MSSDDFVILVVDHCETEAQNLKKLIEFMDAPRVRTAAPEKWRSELGEACLQAVFIGPALSADEIDVVVSDIGKLDPNVPIVMIDAAGAA